MERTGKAKARARVTHAYARWGFIKAMTMTPTPRRSTTSISRTGSSPRLPSGASFPKLRDIDENDDSLFPLPFKFNFKDFGDNAFAMASGIPTVKQFDKCQELKGQSAWTTQGIWKCLVPRPNYPSAAQPGLPLAPGRRPVRQVAFSRVVLQRLQPLFEMEIAHEQAATAKNHQVHCRGLRG